MGSTITSEDQNPQTAPEFTGSIEARTEELVYDIVFDTETVYWGIKGSDGLARLEGDEKRRVTCGVVMVVTDRRVVFVAETTNGGDVDAGSLGYGELASVEVDGEGTLVFTTTDGVEWRFPLPTSETDTVDAALRHLRWVGELRSRLIACKNDVDLTAGEIREHARAREWDLATDEYGSVRETLDRLVGAVQWTDPVPDDVLAPELTDMERTLERALARTFVARARSTLELGRQLVETRHYDGAATELSAAREHHGRAVERAEAVERADSFRFGEQRELRNDIEAVGDRLSETVAELTRAARDANRRADEADDPSGAVDHLESALRLYAAVLDAGAGGRDEPDADDREELRDERASVATRLITRHSERASTAWSDGVEKREDDPKAALRAYENAIAHQERAEELASDFQPEAVAELETRREQMESTVQSIRGTAGADDSPASDREDAGDGESDRGLTDIDSHQRITLETTVEGDGADLTPAIRPNSESDHSARETPGQQEAEGDADDEDLSELTRAILQSDPNRE